MRFYRQTAGHAPFTVELLHGLQMRGDLVRNADGEWIEAQNLDWHILPARVEGIIKERIGRLVPPLQELLRIASVAGETFGAEIVAHVQGVDEQQIAGELDSTLIRAAVGQASGQSTGRCAATHPVPFRHILFQQYLYNSLDPLQRIYLHRAVAEELEQSLWR